MRVPRFAVEVEVMQAPLAGEARLGRMVQGQRFGGIEPQFAEIVTAPVIAGVIQQAEFGRLLRPGFRRGEHGLPRFRFGLLGLRCGRLLRSDWLNLTSQGPRP